MITKITEQNSDLVVEPGRLMHTSEGFYRLMSKLGKDVTSWASYPKRKHWLLLPGEVLKPESTCARCVQNHLTSCSGTGTSYAGVSPRGSPDDSSPYFNPSVRHYAPLFPEETLIKILECEDNLYSVDPRASRKLCVDPRIDLTAVYKKGKISELGLSRKKTSKSINGLSDEEHAQRDFDSNLKYWSNNDDGVGLPSKKIFDFNRIEALIGYYPKFTEQIKKVIASTGLNIALYMAEPSLGRVPYSFKRR